MSYDNFGVIVVFPQCAFSAELPRNTISDMMQDIDDRLNEQGAPEEADARSEIMMNNALSISMMIASRQIEDDTDGIANIAYSFLYAFGKPIGFDKIKDLRGLSGSFFQNRLLMNPCLGDAEFEQQTAALSKKMKEGEDDWEYEFSIPPTIH